MSVSAPTRAGNNPGEGAAVSAALHLALMFSPEFAKGTNVYWRTNTAPDDSAVLKGVYLIYKGGKGTLDWEQFLGKALACRVPSVPKHDWVGPVSIFLGAFRDGIQCSLAIAFPPLYFFSHVAPAC